MGNGKTSTNKPKCIVRRNSFVLIRSDAFITKINLLSYSQGANDSYSSWNVLGYSGTLYWNYWIISVCSKYVEQLWMSMGNTFRSKWNTLFFVFYPIHLCQIFTHRKSIYSLYLPGSIWLTWMLFWQLKQQLNARYASFTSFPLACSIPIRVIFSQGFCSAALMYSSVCIHEIHWRSLCTNCVTLNMQPQAAWIHSIYARGSLLLLILGHFHR